MAFTWENHRRRDGSLDLVAALYEQSREAHAAARLDTARFNQAVEFLDKVEELSLIRGKPRPLLSPTRSSWSASKLDRRNIMAGPTKLELTQALAARNTELQAARVRIAELEGDVVVWRNKTAAAAHLALEQVKKVKAANTPHTGPRPVFEFDPMVPGDFRRAMDLARDNRGVVRRAAIQH